MTTDITKPPFWLTGTGPTRQIVGPGGFIAQVDPAETDDQAKEIVEALNLAYRHGWADATEAARRRSAMDSSRKAPPPHKQPGA